MSQVNLPGEWRAENSGGPLECPTWRLNPQYFLMMFNTLKIRLSLRQREKKKVPIGFYIVRSSAHNRVHCVKPEDVVTKVRRVVFSILCTG